MKNPNDIPISLKVMIAQMSNDTELQNKIIKQAFGELTHKFMKVVNEYGPSDLPFVVASMLIAGRALNSLLGEGGKSLVDTLVSHTDTVAVDLGELLRQNGEDDKEKQ